MDELMSANAAFGRVNGDGYGSGNGYGGGSGEG